MTRAVSTLAVLLALVAGSYGQEPKRDAAFYARAAGDAYKAKDYAGFLEATTRAHDLAPDSTRTWYNLACAFALTGQGERAVVWLNRLAACGLVVLAAEDDDFAAIRESVPFQAALARLAANAAPVHHAETAFTIAERGFVPEGVAYDPVGRAFYVSSVHKRKVVRIGSDGKIADFLVGREEMWSAFGLAVDAKRRRLWVTTGAIPNMVGFRHEDEGRSGVLAYDLPTGRLIRAYTLANAPAHHAVADLAIASNGDVYLTDSMAPALYVVREGAAALEPLVEGPLFASPQGLAFSADERRLYVADYARGIFVFDLVSRTCEPLAHAQDVCLLGVDGLCFTRGALAATQNGILPKRVVRIGLDRTGARVERLDVLEANTPSLGEPTLGTIVDGWFYFNADSQWDRFDDRGNLPPEAELRPHTVMRVRL